MDPLFRRATLEDTLTIGHMLKRFYAKCGHAAYGIPYDHYSALNTITLVIHRGVCIIGHASCAGALLDPFPFNSRALIAQVVFWYFEKPREICVFDQLYVECQKTGATHINAAALAPKQTGKRFYVARGMKLAECHYLGGYGKELPRPVGSVQGKVMKQETVSTREEEM